MPEVFRSFDTGFGTLNIFDPTAASGSPSLFTAINQLAVAQGEALTDLAFGRSLQTAQETALRVLQRPLTQFGNPFDSPRGTTLISPSAPPSAARDLDFGSIAAFLDFQTINPIVSGAGFLGPTQQLIGEARRRQQLFDAQRRSSTTVRNPFRSLQLGPFTPCSADDPAGRCITESVRTVQNRRVRDLVA